MARSHGKGHGQPLITLRAIATRHVIWATALVAVVLTLPTLWAGLIVDDYAQWFSLRSEHATPGLYPHEDWDLFQLQTADRASFAEKLSSGFLPWWTDPTFRLAFFRPLSSLLHAVDYRYLVRWPALLHAESIGSYAALCIVTALVYRRLGSLTGVDRVKSPLAPWAAGVASLLYAADHAHAMAVTWLANRNALIAGLFGFLALYLHDRARRDRCTRSAILAPISFALALLAGEAGIGALALLVAYAWCLEEGPAQKRALSLVPFLGVVAAWASTVHLLGYGVHGTGYYLDPRSDPVQFARAVAVRLPLLLLAQTFLAPADFTSMVEPEHLPLVAGAAMGILGLVFFPVVRRLQGDRLARFFGAALVLTLLPVCAAWPNDRLLIFSGLGAFGLIAVFLARLGPAPSISERVAAGVFVVIHGVIAPIALPFREITLVPLGTYIPRGERTLPSPPAGSTVVVVNAPDPLVVMYSSLFRAGNGGKPVQFTVLGITWKPNEGKLTRIDDQTIALDLRDGYLRDQMSQLVRSPRQRFHTGEVVTTRAVRAEVLEVTGDGRAKRVAFRFNTSVDSPSLAFTRWEGKGFVPVKVPALGETERFGGVDYLEALGAK